MKNTVEIKNGKVVKTFGSRIDFVRESSIYEKIKGKGLAPEVTGLWDGSIEHEFIAGESFNNVINRAMSNPLEFIKYSNIFFKWYKEFRDAVNISLGNMDFSDFIITEDLHLYCIDFEHCKPGYVEDDIANLAASICLMGDAYTRFGMEDAKIFVKAAWERIDIVSGKLYNAINKALLNVCKERSLSPMISANEYLATFVSCAFAHIPDEENMIQTMLESLKISNQEWTLFANDVTGPGEKFIRYIMSSAKEDYNAFYLVEAGNAQIFPLLVKTKDAIAYLTFANELGKDLIDILVDKFHGKGMAVENMK